VNLEFKNYFKLHNLKIYYGLYKLLHNLKYIFKLFNLEMFLRLYNLLIKNIFSRLYNHISKYENIFQIV